MANRKLIECSVLIGLIFALSATEAWSQGMGRGGWAGFGPPPPALMEKFQAWDIWRETHPDVMTLQQTLVNLDGLEQDPKAAMTKRQAKLILTVINPWKTKPAITNDQARRINRQLLAPLTFDQFKAMAASQQDYGDGPGPGGPGGGRPPLDLASFPRPHEYNPLNPATIPMPRQRDLIKQHVGHLIASLAATVK